MRKIKFRAWDSEMKEMRTPGEFAFYVGSSNGLAYDGSSGVLGGFILMQFTGLHDKNGKEIYEGDIIELWSYTAEDGQRQDVERRPVVYMSGVGYPAFDLDGWDHESNGLSELTQSGEWEYEIIGNIYENPELLTV